MAGLIKQWVAWMGWPGGAIAGLVLVGLIGSAGTVWIGGPMAAIPFLDLVALLLAPFPTVVCYGLAALLAFLALRLGLGWTRLSQRAAQRWAAGLAVLGVAMVGFGVPLGWNFAAGIRAQTAQTLPAAVAAPRGGEIALVEQGDARYVRCEAVCLSLLLEDQAAAVEVAASLDEPAPLAVLPGRRFRLTAQTRQCLAGMRDYDGLAGQTSDERHEDFVRNGFLPAEYGRCLDSQAVSVDPARQVTLTEWVGQDSPDDAHRLGYSGPVSVVRTVVPVAGRTPLIQQARYRAGWRYDMPLAIWPYAGNAGFGSYFSPSIAIRRMSARPGPRTVTRIPPTLATRSASLAVTVPGAQSALATREEIDRQEATRYA